ncbi:hypothetical protein DFH11DRAFT_1759708, partial [Phellopilus nigrolimitatus]
PAYIVIVVLLLLVSFVLLLLVALSLPIIKPVYLLSLVSTSSEVVPTDIGTEVRFGVWGYCNVNAYIRSACSVLNVPTLLSNDGECSAPRLGYDVDASILALTGQTELLEVLLKGLTVVLVLHPVCAGLALATLLFALCAAVHAAAICALVLAVAAALLASVSTAADIALTAVAMQKISAVASLNLDFAVRWGNAPWMSLAATVVLWGVVVLLSATLCGCCGVSTRLWTRFDESDEDIGKDTTRLNKEAT